MAPSAVSSLLERVDELGILPDVAVRIHEVAKDPSCSIQDVTSIVELDGALTMRLLKLANSPFYGLTRRVTSIGKAVRLLGLRQTRNLAVAMAIGARSRNHPAARTLWKHSVATGAACSLVARYARTRLNRDDALVVGLLHDTGALLLTWLEADRYLPLLSRLGAEDSRLLIAERMAFGVDHPSLGGAALEHMMFPESTCELVASHHKPPQTPESALLAFAEWLVQEADMNAADRLEVIRGHPSVSNLRLAPATLERIVSLLDAHIVEVSSNFGCE